MGEMVAGTTVSGFDYEIAEDAFDDMELLEALAEMDEAGKFWQTTKVLKIFFGEEQKNAYYEFLRNKYGRVRVTVVADDLGGILNAEGAPKNS